MGCDIHMLIERRDDEGKWRMWTQVFSEMATTRNYERFAALAGVRGEGPEARGLPNDLSEDAKFAIKEGYAVGEHTFSWLPLNEAIEIFIRTEPRGPGRKPWYPSDAYDFFHVMGDETAEYRLVFGFDS